MLNKLAYILQNFKFLNLVLASSLIYVSCSDMDSIHDEYLNGEIIYAGKLDTLKIRPGYYRAQLEGYTQFLGTSNQITIEYEDQIISYPIEENLSEIFSVIIEDLDVILDFDYDMGQTADVTVIITSPSGTSTNLWDFVLFF